MAKKQKSYTSEFKQRYGAIKIHYVWMEAPFGIYNVRK